MRNNSTTATANSNNSRVRVGVFDANRPTWKGSSLSWLSKMRSQKFVLVEGHTLEIRSGYLSENLILLVVVKSPALPVGMGALPRLTSFDFLELPFWSGNNIYADLDQDPPIIDIIHQFWEQFDDRGLTPFFERHVQPIIDELIFNFGGEPCAS